MELSMVLLNDGKTLQSFHTQVGQSREKINLDL